MLDVADALADVVPSVGDLLRRRAALEVDEDRGAASRGVAPEEIEIWGLLQRAFEPLGDLIQRVLDGGAGPRRAHHHGLDDEGRVLVAAKPEIGESAGRHRHQHDIDDQRAIAECPLRQVQLLHDSDPSSRTFWPGRSACTPALTTMSPVSSPCDTVTVAGSKRKMSTLRVDTVSVFGSTIHTAG